MDDICPCCGQRISKKTIGERIQMVRHNRNMGTAELGRKIGVSHSLLSRYESGQRKVSIDRMLDIAAALHVSPMALLGRKAR